MRRPHPPGRRIRARQYWSLLRSRVSCDPHDHARHAISRLAEFPASLYCETLRKAPILCTRTPLLLTGLWTRPATCRTRPTTCSATCGSRTAASRTTTRRTSLRRTTPRPSPYLSLDQHHVNAVQVASPAFSCQNKPLHCGSLAAKHGKQRSTAARTEVALCCALLQQSVSDDALLPTRP